MESLRVVSIGIFEEEVSDIGEEEGEDIVSVAAGAADVDVVSEPVVLALLAQLTKAVAANKKAAQETAVLKR